MSIELKQAAQQAVDAFDAFGDADDFASLFELTRKMRALRTAIQQPEPVVPDSSEHLRVIASLGAALRRLSFAAQTTGGTAGPDAELQSAIGQAEQALSLGGIWQAMSAPGEPVKAERDQLRCAQADAVMPLIGPLLDAWENADREVISQEPELSRQLKAINNAMEDAQPATGEPVAWNSIQIASWIGSQLMHEPSMFERATVCKFVRSLGRHPTLLKHSPKLHPAPSVPATTEPVGFTYQAEIDYANSTGGNGSFWRVPPDLDDEAVPLYDHPAPSVRADVVRDAERYRWLADCNNYEAGLELIIDPKLTAHTLGEKIDAARLADK